jgi:hypothetical protein
MPSGAHTAAATRTGFACRRADHHPASINAANTTIP